MKTDHVVWNPNRSSAICANCGAEFEVKLPIAVKVFCRLTDDFVKAHTNCKKEYPDGKAF